MKTITLSPLGDLTVVKPASWSAVADLALRWPVDIAERGYRERRVRAGAGAIGLVANGAWDLPSYKPERYDFLGYGQACLDLLISRGVRLTEILVRGREVAAWLNGTLPSEAEVEETADFTEAEEPVTLYASESHGFGESIPTGL
mgnify:FL=1|tara:strand:- start:1165 stop:1599 length:435 start_codon:yes stop_codon:yes gene_type:complete